MLFENFSSKFLVTFYQGDSVIGFQDTAVPESLCITQESHVASNEDQR